ncbi:B-cell receptor CD22-like [Cheilinus undulatus]|uniref:B-cell receptor CD22-like n=1 Tax=Cheilinus undulatus TaxID=241271 RepID=UPI001BD551FB|nr:B-cell receptor CD22-like [Cheilinus undulatus]
MNYYGPVELSSKPAYSGRVQYPTAGNDCTLRITNVREDDSAVYKFRVTTNQPDGDFTGAGVTVTVAAPQVQVEQVSTQAVLKCYSRCATPDDPSYVWYRNGLKMNEETSLSISVDVNNRYSCAVKGHENHCSTEVWVQGWGVTLLSSQICAVKGSTVDVPCSFTYPSMINQRSTVIQSAVWFTETDYYEPSDLSSNPAYSGRVQYLFTANACTLRISDIRESDAAEYKFRFTTNQPGGGATSSSGVTLSVTDLQIQVKRLQNQFELKCQSSCDVADNPSYVWYQNQWKTNAWTSTLGVSFQDNNKYSCAFRGQENHRSLEVYAPTSCSVLLSPAGEIRENSGVTLTCSCDGHPAPEYTWYKQDAREALSKTSELVFRSIQSSDSGYYSCGAKNELGARMSQYAQVDVKYAPKWTSISVNSPGETVEGSSVTLTCSSSAKPAAVYTWYKKNKHETPQMSNKGPRLSFDSIQSSDSAEYSCVADNILGKKTSEWILIDVKYGPRLPSVSASPSAEVEEGGSVTLTCSSDANPPANYTWYKENENSPKASGQNFTISSTRPGDSGNYVCVSQNRRGRHSSTILLTVEGAGTGKLISYVTVPAILLALILIFVFIWIRKKRASKPPSDPRKRANNREWRRTVDRVGNRDESVGETCGKGAQAGFELGPSAYMGRALTTRPPAPFDIQLQGQQDELYYATVCFIKKPANPLYSNSQIASPKSYTREEEEKVVYSTVKCPSTSAAQRQQAAVDPGELYSAVNKYARNHGQRDF